MTAACLGFFMVGLTSVGLSVGVLLLATFLMQSNLKACRVVTELPLSCVYNAPVLSGLLPLVCNKEHEIYCHLLQVRTSITSKIDDYHRQSTTCG